jgi:NAD(P)-dependent dehydrogenase (short-subunit alcohol dehydrogenase family)
MWEEIVLLQGKVAIVTGGGRGIGRAIARKFAAEGAAVVVAARSDDEVRKTAADIQAAGGRTAAVVADVAHEPDCERVVRVGRESFGAIHILVNNAAILGPVRPAEKIAPQEWDEVIAVNLRGPFLLSRLVLHEMYERGSGAILNVVSIAAKAAFQLNSPYAASKAGLIGLTHVPETKMSQELGNKLAEYLEADSEKIFSQMFKGILQGRPQTAEEIASAALFLVSDQASAITGQTLNVDGGMAFY